MKWFRLHADFLYNPKIQIVTEALRYRYVALLCLHCSGDYENRPDDEIALSLRVTVEDWIYTRNEFVKRELLTPDYKIKGWEKKQYISDIKDPTAAERQKRYRAKHRDTRNASVTSRLPDSDTDTNTDKEKKKIEAVASFVLPDWIPKQDWDDWIKARPKKATPRAMELAVSELVKLKAQGFDPQAVLQHCIMNGYQGIYPPKGNTHASIGKPNSTITRPNKTERLEAAVRRAAESGGFAPRPEGKGNVSGDDNAVVSSIENVWQRT